MCPILYIFGKQISPYVLMAGVGILLGMFFIFLYLLKDKKKMDDALYIYIFGIIGAIIGSKVFYLFTVADQIIEDLPYLFSNTLGFFGKYLSGGFVFYGGLIGGIFFAWIFARVFRVALKDYTFALVPALIIFAACGRIGCFMVGCCYGIEAHTPISVIFPPGGEAPDGVELIPTQLIEAVIDGVFFVVFLIYGRWRNKNQKGPDVLSLYLVMYSVMRFLLEFVRGDEIRGFFLGISTSQWISIVIIAVVIAFHLFRRRQKASCQ